MGGSKDPVQKFGAQYGIRNQEPAETNGGHLQAASPGKIPGHRRRIAAKPVVSQHNDNGFRSGQFSNRFGLVLQFKLWFIELVCAKF
jgi:hypothetical protein